MAHSVGIITCISNGSGFGPGHTALWVDGTLYSFEQMGSRNAWLVTPVEVYANLGINRGRPLIYYRLNGRVSADDVKAFLVKDSSGWSMPYGPNVCSQRASIALDAGTFGGFNPHGIDTPFGVYWCAWRKQVVAEWWAVWKQPALQSTAAQKRIYSKLEEEYQVTADDLYLG